MLTTGQAQPTRLRPTDAFRHKLPDHPAAREAMYWNAALPDEGLGLAVYATMKATGETSQVILIYADEGRHGLDEAFVDHVPDAPFEGDDLDDFKVARLHVRQPEPLRSWEIAYQGDRVSLEFSWEAITPAFDYWQNPNGSPLAFTSGNRVEQSGRMRGRLVLDGRTVELDTTSHHDHSWGHRDWHSMLHYKWMGAQAGDGTSSGHLAPLAIHAAQIVWRGQVCINGYVERDGQQSPIVDARFGGTYDADVHTRTQDLEFLDAAGRVTRATAERFAGTRFPFPGVMLTETACRFQIEGRPGVGVVEMLFPEGYMDHVASNWSDLAGS